MNMVANKWLSFSKEFENFYDLVESHFMIINKFHTFFKFITDSEYENSTYMQYIFVVTKKH